jgi:hypothetical protein
LHSTWPALDFLALGAAEQRTDVVAGLALIEQLAEHFDAGDGGLLGSDADRRFRFPRRP